MKKLLEYGYSATKNHTFYNPGDKIAKIPVWYGRQPDVIATIEKPFTVTVPKDAGLDGVRVLARYNDPLPAPVRTGDKIGEIIAQRDGREIARAPLVAQNTVKKTLFFGRVIKNIRVIFGID